MKGFFLFLTLIFASPLRAEEGAVEPVVVIGGGVGALSSAIYLARAGLHPLVMEGSFPGGLLTQSESVQNWPGIYEINGKELVDSIRAQGEANGVRFLAKEVAKVDFSKRPFRIVTADSHTIQAESCIIATGTTPNYLHIPGEKEYWGKGVSNCAVCDGSFYKNKKVAVIGGGDAAVLEGLYLSNLASEVSIFIRKDKFTAHEKSRTKALLEKSNVKVFYNTKLSEIQGDGEKITRVVTTNQVKIPVDGVFLAIGSRPNSQLFEKQLELTSDGYIALKLDQATSVPGVYATGDVADRKYKQAISAAGDGAKAAIQVEQFLSTGSLQAHQVAVAEIPKAELIEIESMGQWKEEMKKKDGWVLVDFYSPRCGPCKQIAASLNQSARELGNQARFLKVNIDRFSELANQYHIQSIPTILVFDLHKNLVQTKVGTGEIREFLHLLETKEIAEAVRDQTRAKPTF